MKRATLNVEAGATTAFRAPVLVNERGSHLLMARIDAPGMMADRNFEYVVDVVSRLRVLVISGDEREGSSAGESWYLRNALAPFGGGNGGRGNPADIAVVKDWPGELRSYNVVVLANVPQITAAQARALEQYVYEGGGLLVAPGGLSRVENYNTLLYRNGSGLLPARLGTSVGGWSTPAYVASLDSEHPIFKFINGWQAMPSAVVGRYFPAVAKPLEARVLGTLSSGEPYAVEGLLGRGRVLLLTTPLEVEWNQLPLSSFYLPFVQSAARYLGGSGKMPRNVKAGEPLVAVVDENVDEKTVLVRTPEESQTPRGAVSVSPLGQHWRVSYSGTHVPGVYRMRAGNSDILFAVQPPREESDLTPVSPERWRGLKKDLGFEEIDPERETVGAAIVHVRNGRELWLVCLGGVVFLGMVELWIGGYWSSRQRR